MNPALRHFASLAWKEKGFLIRILEAHGHLAGKTKHVCGYFILIVPESHFPRPQFYDSDAGILGLKQYVFPDRHIIFSQMAAQRAGVLPTLHFHTNLRKPAVRLLRDDVRFTVTFPQTKAGLTSRLNQLRLMLGLPTRSPLWPDFFCTFFLSSCLARRTPRHHRMHQLRQSARPP